MLRSIKPRTLPVLLSLVVACGVSGCESPEAVRQANQQQCTSYGFQPGTVPFSECLQRESLAQRYELDQTAHPSWWNPPYAPAWR
jgi:hypothetical protein